MDNPLLQDALAQQETVLRTFVDADGRISQMPAKRVKRLALLDHVAGSFEVNIMASPAHSPGRATGSSPAWRSICGAWRPGQAIAR